VAERVIGTDLVESTEGNGPAEGDRLFLIAEELSQDFSLFRERQSITDQVKGLVGAAAIRRELEALRELDIDAYIERCVAPAEDPTRIAAPAVIQRLGRVLDEHADGPYYTCVLELDFGTEVRQLGVLAQDRSVRNGVWGPQHHTAAALRVDQFSKRRLPVVCFMDTPGADAEDLANRNNQAHSISRLIAEMCNLDVPNIGIVFGLGYSGGAIPLASANLILSVRDGVFSTIQPRGLANIARRYNLSWQECAKQVGVSAFELYRQGNVDGVIDYTPAQPDIRIENLRLAIASGIRAIEDGTKRFVIENPYIFDHYQRSLTRYLAPSKLLQSMQSRASMSLTTSPTEYHNVFGVSYRYLRYLNLRRRLRSTPSEQYGRLSARENPQGQLAQRTERERRQSFLSWLQDPEKLVYDEGLAKAVRTYTEKKQALHQERGRLAQFFLGAPQKNFADARQQLLTTTSMYLYNRWKTEARGNLSSLIVQLREHANTRQLLRVQELQGPIDLARRLTDTREPILVRLRDGMSYEARKLFRSESLAERTESAVRALLTTELNLAMTAPGSLARADASLESQGLSQRTIRLAAEGAAAVTLNRSMLNDLLPQHVPYRAIDAAAVATADRTVLDLLLDDDLREDFVQECENLQLFDAIYDNIISRLDSIAEEAEKTRALSQQSLGRLVQGAFEQATKVIVSADSVLAAQPPAAVAARLNQQFVAWYERLVAHAKSKDFMRAVEEWKKSAFPHLSDTLFVVLTFLLERLLPSYFQAQTARKRFDGRITPTSIGRRKDFWNRLTIAYRDLLIQNLLTQQKRKGSNSHTQFVEQFFSDFEELNEGLLSSDPVQFPGFRLSIEEALGKKIPPCGTVTGIGSFRLPGGDVSFGVVISNVAFQAGAFDMASAEKVCKLLVRCAQDHLPVVAFVSSGGMQTKEGAGALFSMAVVNDRVTRFVRDNDLPFIVFGFGDCTGGAQASFVTHPLAQTYYFSGTSMPFAGQIVVPSNLPLTSILSNYLSLTQGAMQGLVKHPFAPDLDQELRRIDPDIPVAQESVAEVVARILEGRLTGRAAQVPRVRSATDRALVKPVKRVLIHARGCTAVKLIRGAQELGIDVVLVQSDPDMESTAVDMLGDRDRVVCIGGNTPDESYLNAKSVVSVAEHEGVDALHPGIGFLSENAQFAALVRAHRINFVGPPVRAMETMGNKSNAIAAARKLGVPVVPGSHGIVEDVYTAAEVADGIGYPVLIKAVHGGGGKGIQVVERREDFHEFYHRVSLEARSAFGNGDVYLERFVTQIRHIEVQVLRDTHGNCQVLGLRDCSVQRDKQKVLEESGSTMLPDELEAKALEYARALADEVQYVGAGTVEFIFDLDAGAVYFMEMNTRLQVEHPVTEMVSGVDIVAEQFRIAGGASIAELPIAKNGYAIEARINAERIVVESDGRLGFRPVPGRVDLCRWAESEHVQIISAIAPGKWIPPFYDSMVAQVIAHGADRDEAVDRLRDFLKATEITGVATNIPVLLRILDDAQFRGGNYSTGYLPELFTRLDADALIADIERAAGHAGAAIDASTIAIEGSDELKVLAPSSGIFYGTPSPAEPEYVSVGEIIDVDRTLCQLEAMKIFTPLKLADFNAVGAAPLYPADRRYRIARVNLASGQQVNAGDLLFVVRPV
jgi:acetyl/propionyl-CoA carboxylase alpha subunit